MNKLYFDYTKKPNHFNFKDIEYQKFGRLLVSKYAGKLNNNHYWRCICDCGNQRYRISVMSDGTNDQANHPMDDRLKPEPRPIIDSTTSDNNDDISS